MKLPEIGQRYKRKFDDKRVFVIVKVISGKVSNTGCEQYEIRDEADLNYRAHREGWNYDEYTFNDEFDLMNEGK
ncbi:MAG: hypothetical protein Q7U04_08355 [Bacteriovorax sp.]|nr:hypothetical protein [Bacteriovorax sp.]